MLTLGVSRGSEAALLLGVHYPSLVHGVVASVPSDVVHGSYPAGGPAWTRRARPIPPGLVIPVERIREPVFLDCAGLDEIWPSCASAAAIARRLGPHPHVLYRAPQAGHGIGSFVPYEPGYTLSTANERARERLWPHLLAFLAHA